MTLQDMDMKIQKNCYDATIYTYPLPPSKTNPKEEQKKKIPFFVKASILYIDIKGSRRERWPMPCDTTVYDKIA